MIGYVWLEIFFWTFAVVFVYYWVSARVEAAVRQIRQEEFLREVSRRVEQKKKIDELYGRNKDNNKT